MAKITEDYVSFKTAKLLKEKGFEGYTMFSYSTTRTTMCGHWENETDWLPKCTLQMAMKWLREVHKLEIYPFHDTIQENNNWWFRVEKHTKGCGITLYESDSIYLKFEEACEIAIKYCLEHLI